MNPYLQEFIHILEQEDRHSALQFITEKLQNDSISILELYEEILTPALNTMQPSGNENVDIWKEHIRTSIIKTILENAYPYVLKEKQRHPESAGQTVAVLCPPEEYHNVGARMVADMLSIYGFNAIFVDSNTPQRVILAGMDIEQIDWIVISISNPYHLVSTRKIIEAIRQKDPSVQIMVGGNAIQHLGEKSSLLQADHILTSLRELKGLQGGQHEARL